MNVVILDTGCANLNSVKSAIARHGYEPVVSRDPDVVLRADKLFLPGVGTAQAAMDQIRERELVDLIKACTQPVLGICLGMQILGRRSEESNGVDLLGIIDDAFTDCVDGQFVTGASAYEKRGTAVMVPEWDAEKCIQCNNCAFVCSHATIRPFLLSDDEVKAAPSNIKLADMKPKGGDYKYTMSVSPLDCMGCGECVTVCPTAAIAMVPQPRRRRLPTKASRR